MFESMAGCVGCAMHDDLMMRPKTDARVAEAMREWKRQQRAMPRRSYREALAKALVALAARLAPPMPTTGERGVATTAPYAPRSR